jgi:hypothetical protein
LLSSLAGTAIHTWILFGYRALIGCCYTLYTIDAFLGHFRHEWSFSFPLDRFVYLSIASLEISIGDPSHKKKKRTPINFVSCTKADRKKKSNHTFPTPSIYRSPKNEKEKKTSNINPKFALSSSALSQLPFHFSLFTFHFKNPYENSLFISF